MTNKSLEIIKWSHLLWRRTLHTRFTKSIIILIMLLAAGKTTTAQLGIRTSYLKYSGDMGFDFKPSLGFELIWFEIEPDRKLQVGLSIGFARMNTWLDTIHYGFFTQDNSTGQVILIPSYITYDNVKNYSIGFNIEYRILNNDFSPVIGTDLYVNFIEYNYDEYIPGFINKSVMNELTTTMGILPRLGFIYSINDNIVIEGGLGKSLSYDYTFKPYLYWKIYTGVIYYFNTY